MLLKTLKYDLKSIKYLLKYILQKKKYIDEEITKIHVISYRPFTPQGGRGGGSAVQTCQKILLGETYQNIPIQYSFSEPNKYSTKRKNSLWCLWATLFFVFQKIPSEKNTAYITHDYCTAFGLYLLGKKYALVSHIQGARAEEKKNFGEKFSVISKKIIQYCEKKAFQNAAYVCFPSEGAYKYFCQSKYKTFSESSFRKGPILYNTLYVYPQPEKYLDLKKESKILTILSIGQLSLAKGLDLHPDFLDNILKIYHKPLRYIYVGDGPLSQKIEDNLNRIQKLYPNFSYIHVKKCSYPQIQYLEDICDVYLMLHRISIFDLSTLELMRKSKTVILSEVGGNKEFNKEKNILFYKDKNWDKIKEVFEKENFEEFGKLNHSVYENYFSNQKFIKSYQHLMLMLATKNRVIIVEKNGTKHELKNNEIFPGIKIVNTGFNNTIYLHQPLKAENCLLEISNDNCVIDLGKSNYLKNLYVRCDRGIKNKLVIKDGTSVAGMEIF